MNNNVVYVASFPNNKVYVGIAADFKARKGRHKHAARYGHISNFNHAIRKYGFNSIKWYIIDQTDNSYELRELEKIYIQIFDSYKNGYNMTFGGDGWHGCTHSKQTKKKLRDYRLGRKHTKKTLKLFSKQRKGEKHPLFGKKHTKKTKQRISNSLKGQVLSENSKIKLAISMGSKLFEVYYNNTLVGEWINKSECSRNLNIDRHAIRDCLNNKRLNYKGYYFKYAGAK